MKAAGPSSVAAAAATTDLSARIFCTIAVLIAILSGSPSYAFPPAPPPEPADLLRGLDTDDPKAISEAIAAIERTSSSREMADVLFAAGRACEDRLYDPARALALYERILRDTPDAGVSIAAGRRAAMLRGAKGHAREAAQLAQLIATADATAPAEVERLASELAAAAWPGAVDAALFLADWLCRTGRQPEAQVRYAKLIADSPDASQVHLARRNAAGCAIDAKNWLLAEQLTQQLGTDDVDEAVRASLIDNIAMGRRRDTLYGASWIALLVAGIVLLGSLAESVLRGGPRAPAWQPPTEVLYIGPVALVVVVATLIIDQLIASAVVQISIAGFVAAWISGATLDLLRRRNRSVRVRSVVHVLACGAIVLGVGYIAMTRGDLLDLLGETVTFGPGA